MSDIRFIQAQGELLDAAIADALDRHSTSVPKRRRLFRRPPKRVAIVLVGLVVAGCAAAAAAGLLSSSQRLYLGHVNCYYGTGVHVAGTTRQDALDTGAVLVGGETPTAWCTQEFKFYSSQELRRMGMKSLADNRLVSCQMNASTVGVFIASGAKNQCTHLGFSSLPSTFNAAAASVNALARRLRELYLSRDCWQPQALANASRAALTESGLTGWRVILPQNRTTPDESPIGLGACGAFISPNPYSGNPYQSFSAKNRTLTLTVAISRSIYNTFTRIDNRLASETIQHCYSRAGIHALVHQAFAPTGMTPQIAITANPNGGPGFSFGSTKENRHFQQGCPILFLSWPTLNDHFADVWLIARPGEPLQAGQDPSPADFHR